ncbi:MAG TPA: AsmA family protein [Terriglobia bacterium]|nr:AsmA family protein [Terriglobia bacterium]
MTTAPDVDPKPSFIRRHPVVTGLLLLLAIVFLLLIGGIWFLATADYRGFAQSYLSKKLERPVSIGALQISWGDPLTVNLRDLRLANAAWGSTPDMATVGQVSAALDMRALLHAKLRFRMLTVDTPLIVLERDPSGRGNWLFGAAAKAAPPAQQPEADQPKSDVTPAGRGDFPVLLDFALSNGKITYRTFSGNILRVDLHTVTLKTSDEDQPVEIAATGAYNGADLALAAQTHSFRELHDTAKPFGAKFTLTRQAARLTFDGTLIDPLNVDGADGMLKIDAPKLSDILGIFHTTLGSDPAAGLAGHLTRQGDFWHLAEAKGELGGNALTGKIDLIEGRRGKSDDIKFETAFDELNLDRLLPPADKKKSGGATQGWQDMPLDTPDKSAPRLAAKLSAAQVRYKSLTAADMRIEGSLAPGRIEVDSAALALAGIPLQARGSLTAAQAGGKLTAALDVKNADFQALAKLLDSPTRDLSGKLTGAVSLTLQGKTIRDGLKASSGGAVISMMNGRVSRDLLEKASIDLRNVFRKGEGSAQVSCLLAVLRLKNGVGALAPVRLRSSEATLNGEGRVDFLAQTLDLTLQSDRKSTSFLALDIPIRLSGPWQQPKVSLLGKAGRIKLADDPTGDLPPALQGIIEANSCRQ